MSVGSVASNPIIQLRLEEEDKSHLFKRASKIGEFVKKTMLFPFNPKREEKKAEETYTSHDKFWDLDWPDLDYHHKQEVKELFVRKYQVIAIEKEGKTLEIKCLIFESKEINEGDEVHNHLIVQGNTSTLNNNFPGIYPFLEGHVKKNKGKKARFVVFNHYDHLKVDDKGDRKAYLPSDMDEWGFIFKKGIEGLTSKFGKFDTMSAHSLGNMPMIAQLKHWKVEDFRTLFPKTLLLAKGPSSFYETSKNVPFSLGIYPWGWFFIISPILYFLAKLTGWTLELDETLVDYLKKVAQAKASDADLATILDQTKIVITQVKNDYYFPGKAGLCSSKKLDELKETDVTLYRLSFEIESQRSSKQFTHNYPPHGFQANALIKEKITKGQNVLTDLEGSKTILSPANPRSEDNRLQFGQNLAEFVVSSVSYRS